MRTVQDVGPGLEAGSIIGFFNKLLLIENGLIVVVMLPQLLARSSWLSLMTTWTNSKSISASCLADGDTMYILESDDTPPPMPFSCLPYGSGEPIAAAKIGCHAA